MRSEQIVLSGPPGAGKSTVARLVADRLQKRAHDLDLELKRNEGETAAACLLRVGEAQFRALEAEALRKIPTESAVIALGGGTLTTREGRRLARARGPLFGLWAPPLELAERLERSGETRPLVQQVGLNELLQVRRTSYQAIDRSLDTCASPAEVAQSVIDAATGIRVLQLPIGHTTTRVVVGHGLIEAVIGAIVAVDPSRAVLFVLDSGAPQQFLATLVERTRALYPTVTVELAGGEAVKTWEVLGQVLSEAISGGCGRQSVVVGVGGGAILDLSALTGALLGRGAPAVLVPTTLLAQVDAAVGGKCAVNLGGRNLVGAFWPASDVIVDVDFLTSLPKEELRSGLAEMLKIGIVCDPALFRDLAEERRATAPLIVRAIEAKAAIVAADPDERGSRKWLNLGHTLGHALEAASNYEIRHGEAVAMGIAAVVRFSRERGWLAASEAHTILSALVGLGLAVSAPVPALLGCASYLDQDKKAGSTEIELVSVLRIGEVRLERVSLELLKTELVRCGVAQ